MSKRVLIVGGVAGGASTAARLRRLDEAAEIIMFEKGEYISFANCGLPYYIGEVIKDREKLVVQTPEDMKKRFNIDVRTNSEVIKINRQNKTLEVYDKISNETYTENYDQLVLSPGAEPLKPKLNGIDSQRIFALRNIPDTYRIKDFVDAKKPKNAVIVGAGFIGLETAENLHSMGINVTIVELSNHVIGPLDFEMAAFVHQHLRSKGVKLYLEDAVIEFVQDNNALNVTLSSSLVLQTDMVVLGIGVRPETKLAKEAGLKLGRFGGIAVNKFMQTSDPDIYAVGDAAEVIDFMGTVLQNLMKQINGKTVGGTVLTNQHQPDKEFEGTVLIPLAGPANKQGRIAADNICGHNSKYNGTQGTSIAKVFDMTVALTGINERQLVKLGIVYEKSYTYSPSHAGYYPGSTPMNIKLLFAKSNGKVLGAQIVGYDGVDKRIDVIAAAIRAGMTVFDLQELELSYAPPYSSAKDPVNIAGYVASNLLKGDADVFHWDEVKKLDRSKVLLIDVRTKMEYSIGTIDGSVNMPVDELRDRINEIPIEKDIYLFCQVGLRGYIAARMLIQKGFKTVKNLSGGYLVYNTATQKQTDEDKTEDRTNELPEKSGEKSNCTMKTCETEECGKPKAYVIDTCGMQCPGPIMKVYESLKMMEFGDTLVAKATDPAFENDIKIWCERTNNNLISISHDGKIITATIGKGRAQVITAGSKDTNDKTIVVFSGDLDRAIAAFIIANGAAAMGRKVTLFFTFWGLNILRKTLKVKVKKNIISKMFGAMMPRGSKKLALSRMNMAGAGSKLIRYLMKKKNVPSLEELIDQAFSSGVSLVACNMSMDLMGIKREELIDGITVGGVATFLGSAEESDMSLFV